MTEKAKAMFFAQYLGHPFVYEYTAFGYSPPSNITCEYLWIWESNPGNEPILLLRSIEQLTDQEKINLCILSYTAIVGNPPSNEGTFAKERHIKTGAWLASDIKLISLAGADYLRSIGILLPLTYLNENNKPTTLTPEAIIQLGWAKIDNK